MNATSDPSWTPAAALDEALQHTAPRLVTEVTGLLSGEQVIRLCKAITRVRGIDAKSEAESAERVADLFDAARERLAVFRDEQIARIQSLSVERFDRPSRLD